MTHLCCSFNNLSDLPELPDKLIMVDCMKNQLLTLPNLPINMSHLYCSHNNLSGLPKLPDKLIKCDCDNNPFVDSIKIDPDFRDILQKKFGNYIINYREF
jgi:Leucine-rich repeat (LRR) protein